MSYSEAELINYVISWHKEFMSSWQCDELVLDHEREAHSAALAEVTKRIEDFRPVVKMEEIERACEANPDDPALGVMWLVEELGHTIDHGKRGRK